MKEGKFSHRCSGMWVKGGNKVQCEEVLDIDSVVEMIVNRSEVTKITKEGSDVNFEGCDRQVVYGCDLCGSQTVAHSFFKDRFEEMKDLFLSTSSD